MAINTSSIFQPSTEIGPLGGITSNEIQDAINALQLNIDDSIDELSNHIRGINTAIKVDAHAASSIIVVPTANISSTDVQAALEEIQAEIDGFVSGTGQANDGLNIGTVGVGPFDGKSGVNLEFKNRV